MHDKRVLLCAPRIILFTSVYFVSLLFLSAVVFPSFSFCDQSAGGKLASLWMPITAFVTLGLEHSVRATARKRGRPPHRLIFMCFLASQHGDDTPCFVLEQRLLASVASQQQNKTCVSA